MTTPRLRPARGRWERALAKFPTPLFWLVAAVLFFICGVTTKQLLHPPVQPPLLTVQGTLVGAKLDKYWLQLNIAELPFVLKANPSPNHATFHAAIEHQLVLGEVVEVVVDENSLRDAQASGESAVADAAVFVRGLRVGEHVVLTPEQAIAWEKSNHDTNRYAAVITGLIAALVLACGWRRRQLIGLELRESEALASADEAQSLLSRKAPFQLHAKFGRRERGTALLVLILVGGMGLGALYEGSRQLLEVRSVVDTWEHGDSGSAEIVSHIKEGGHHRLKLALDAAHGGRIEPYSFHDLRTKLWPLRAPVSLRFSKSNAQLFVTELDYHSRAFSWGCVAVLMLVGSGFVGLALWLVAKQRKILDDVQELARTGQLQLAEVVKLETVYHENMPTIQLTYKLERGREKCQPFAVGSSPPLLHDGQAVVVANFDHSISHALHADGYPFELPQAALQG